MSKLPTAPKSPHSSGAPSSVREAGPDAFLQSRISFDLVFADPPYFLSNGGITCHAGRMVSVNKGDWDKIKRSRRQS
jgi:DNA modification methylase